MEAKELRIGNAVIKEHFDQGVKNGETIHCVTSHDIESLDVHGYIEHGDEVLKPIPLTEEILLKAGFKEDDGFFYMNEVVGFNTFCLIRDGDMFELYHDATVISCCSYIYYVHQLQNLYFALTGEELDIKF